MQNQFLCALGAIAFVGLSGGLISGAYADDGVYTGRTTIQSGGSYPQFCLPRDMQIKVTGAEFALGSVPGAPPTVSGPVKADGTFSAIFQPQSPPGARVTIQPITIQGVVQGATITGTLSQPTGCVAKFALQKQ